jgi:hypothetical protein
MRENARMRGLKASERVGKLRGKNGNDRRAQVFEEPPSGLSRELTLPASSPTSGSGYASRVLALLILGCRDSPSRVLTSFVHCFTLGVLRIGL